ncbi:MAG TPA: hypothetical protein VFL42_01820 [Terriglobales bacterium]|nr:hypothetical protein [Terriglobales bacterium]
MAANEISSEEEAQELLAKLEQFYKQPVLPLGRFCAAIELWMECVIKNNTDPALVADYRPEMLQPYFKQLPQIRMDIRKSNLLGRLLYAKEKFRTRTCPLHKGH